MAKLYGYVTEVTPLRNGLLMLSFRAIGSMVEYVVGVSIDDLTEPLEPFADYVIEGETFTNGFDFMANKIERLTL